MKNKIRLMFSIFDKKQKLKIAYITFILLIDAVVELLGVTAILPFIDAVTQPDNLVEKPYIKWIMGRFALDVNSLIVVIAIGIIIIYILKNVFLLYITNLQLKFSYYGKRELSNRFMRCYIRQDYTYHLKHNSAEMMRDISNDVDMFYSTVLNFMQLVSELVVSFVLIAFLLIKDFFITVGVAVSLCFMVVFFIGKYKKTLVQLGKDRRYYSFKTTQYMQQGFGGIKEIKISNQEEFFIGEYADANNKNAEAIRKNVFLNAVPKPVMEALCIAGLMLVISIKVMGNADKSTFVGTLAVFAVAAFKLLPSVNKISSLLGNIFHTGVVIPTVVDKYKLLGELEAVDNDSLISEKSMTFSKGIEVRELTYRYPDTDRDILRGVNFDIEKNTSVAFIGPSGAGKTTTVDVILGLLNPASGKVLVDGVDIAGNISAWRHYIGYIPQNIYMLDDTIRNNVSFGMADTDDDKVWHALEEAQLADFIRTLPDGLDTMIGEAGVRISGGQRQRIGIARALYRNPELLVLDEATSALDSETEKAVMESIEHLQGKMTMIIIAHRLTTIEHCDHVYEIDNGCVTKKR